MLTTRTEITDRMLIASEQELRAACPRTSANCNTGRSNRRKGMELRAPDDAPDVIAFPVPVTQIQRRARLAGLINE